MESVTLLIKDNTIQSFSLTSIMYLGYRRQYRQWMFTEIYEDGEIFKVESRTSLCMKVFQISKLVKHVLL
jgi:hypothetical protein